MPASGRSLPIPAAVRHHPLLRVPRRTGNSDVGACCPGQDGGEEGQERLRLQECPPARRGRRCGGRGRYGRPGHYLDVDEDDHELPIPLRDQPGRGHQGAVQGWRSHPLLPRLRSRASPGAAVPLWRHRRQCRRPRPPGLERAHLGIAGRRQDPLRLLLGCLLPHLPDADRHRQDDDAGQRHPRSASAQGQDRRQRHLHHVVRRACGVDRHFRRPLPLVLHLQLPPGGAPPVHGDSQEARPQRLHRFRVLRHLRHRLQLDPCHQDLPPGKRSQSVVPAGGQGRCGQGRLAGSVRTWSGHSPYRQRHAGAAVLGSVEAVRGEAGAQEEVEMADLRRTWLGRCVARAKIGGASELVAIVHLGSLAELETTGPCVPISRDHDW